MVVDEADRVALPVGIATETLVIEGLPVATTKGFVEFVLEGEVEGSTGHTCACDPVGDGILAVPVLTHAELRLSSLVVESGIIG